MFNEYGQLFRDANGIHGTEHAYRVLANVTKLSILLDIGPVQRHILYNAALYHDIGREHNGTDTKHGFKSIKKLEKHNLHLNMPNYEYVKYIIENHCISDRNGIKAVENYNVDKDTAVYLLKVFKDCDALDRTRTSDLDEKYLRFPESKKLLLGEIDMFKNFKVVAHMRTPIVTIEPIILDSIILAAKAKEILGEEFYSGKNVVGTEEEVRSMLDPILDRKHNVYCTGIGIGEHRESVTSWTKRWDEKNDDIVKFNGKGKERVDIGSGFYKNYHMPVVTKSYKTITFCVRGNMEEVKRLLENYIFYLGKKGSQGFGQVKKWEFEEIEADWSIYRDGKLMRPVPAKECKEKIEEMMQKEIPVNARQHPILPPYWRKETELCLMPEGM